MAEEGSIERLLNESGALQRGHFALSSGLHSPSYVQCALLLQDPARARQVGAWLADRLRPHGPQSVLSPALGGVLIGHEVAASLGVPFRFAERHGGELELRRGFCLAAAERVVIVEDVVTTGRSTLETARLAEARGAAVVAIGAIIDRTSASGPGFPVPFAALVRMELEATPPDACAACASGEALDKPGSRSAAGSGHRRRDHR